MRSCQHIPGFPVTQRAVPGADVEAVQNGHEPRLPLSLESLASEFELVSLQWLVRHTHRRRQQPPNLVVQATVKRGVVTLVVMETEGKPDSD